MYIFVNDIDRHVGKWIDEQRNEETVYELHMWALIIILHDNRSLNIKDLAKRAALSGICPKQTDFCRCYIY